MIGMSQDEANQKIAEWLGWRQVGTRWHSLQCQRDEGHCNGKVPDFYADEAANALVLEKLPLPTITRRLEGWYVSYYSQFTQTGMSRPVMSVGRKTAIAEAALTLIESQKGEH